MYDQDIKLGGKVLKKFPGHLNSRGTELFEGTVTDIAVMPDSGDPPKLIYRVVFEDQDSAQYYAHQLRPMVKMWLKVNGAPAEEGRLDQMAAAARRSQKREEYHARRRSEGIPDDLSPTGDTHCLAFLTGWTADPELAGALSHQYANALALSLGLTSGKSPGPRRLAADILEPKGYREAQKTGFAREWRDAISKELRGMMTFDVWEIVPRRSMPGNARPINTTWVFKVKSNSDGTVERFKARLCARGFLQRAGLDYFGTFAPVARLSTIRLIVALSARWGLKMSHLDFKSAFLQGVLEEPLYMEPPEGWRDTLVPILAEQGKVLRGGDILRLKRGIYGLKQAGRIWYTTMCKGLLEIGFEQSVSDTCLFHMIEENSTILITTWVDDCIVSFDNAERWKTILARICKKFTLGAGVDFEWCLGMAVHRDKESGDICLHQSLYVQNLLKRFKMEDAAVVRTPADPSVTLNKEMSPQSDAERALAAKVPYRELLGALLHLANFTRPDIAIAVNLCARYASDPGEEHWNALKRILRYLKGTIDPGTGNSPGLRYKGRDTGPLVEGYVDADHARCPDTRKSTLGYMFFSGTGPISWEATKQKIIAQSTAEAEYIALAEATKEAIWLRKILRDLQLAVPTVKIWEDNQACIKLVENPVHHKRTKHIDIRYHFVRDHLKKEHIDVQYVKTDDQLADILTKPLPKPRFESLAERILSWPEPRPWHSPNGTHKAKVMMMRGGGRRKRGKKWSAPEMQRMLLEDAQAQGLLVPTPPLGNRTPLGRWIAAPAEPGHVRGAGSPPPPPPRPEVDHAMRWEFRKRLPPWRDCPMTVEWLEFDQWNEHETLVKLLERKALSRRPHSVSAALMTLTLGEIQQELDLSDLYKVALIGQVWDFFSDGELAMRARGPRWDKKIFVPTIIALLKNEQRTSQDIAAYFSEGDD